METISLFEDKQILLAVTGSIAAYKAIDLASKLTQRGAKVDVILTESGARFVTPLAFESVTGRQCYTTIWQNEGTGGLPTHVKHIGLGERANLMVVAPATANTLAKLAVGLADDLLSVTAVAARCPLMVAPAMDGGMYQHPTVQANLATLRERGVMIVEPEVGRFASGLVGKGRLPEVPTLIGAIRAALGRKGALAGRHVVVTAGGTREAVDPVRFITNRSSGKQGHALAQAAADAGADVTLITTMPALDVPYGATVVPVNSARQMLDAVLGYAPTADALLMAAAVADFRPTLTAEHKIKKSDDGAGIRLDLERTEDILLAVKALRAEGQGPRVVVGFAAESQHLLENALGKLERKGVDLLVANDITAADAGFEVDTNRVVILDAAGGQERIDLATKARISEHILARAAALLGA